MIDILAPTLLVLGAYVGLALITVKVTKELRTADLFYGGPMLVLGVYFYYFVVDGPTPLYFSLSLVYILWGGRLVLLMKGRLKKEGRGFKRSPIKNASLARELICRAGCLFFLLTPLLSAYLFRTSAAHIRDLEPLPLAGLIAGGVLFLAGFTFEAVADAQMAVFQRRPENHRRILKSGLWRYSRHPYYFGECLLWWGIALITITHTLPYGIISLAAPLATIVSLRALLSNPPSARMERETYRRYVSRTSSFIPWPPRKEEKPRKKSL